MHISRLTYVPAIKNGLPKLFFSPFFKTVGCKYSFFNARNIHLIAPRTNIHLTRFLKTHPFENSSYSYPFNRRARVGLHDVVLPFCPIFLPRVAGPNRCLHRRPRIDVLSCCPKLCPKCCPKFALKSCCPKCCPKSLPQISGPFAPNCCPNLLLRFC